MPNGVFNRGKQNVGKYDVTGFTLRAMLVNTSFPSNVTFDPDLNFVSEGTSSGPFSYEISVGGYARQTLAAVTLTEDDTNDFAYVDANDVTFSALVAGQTVGGCVVYKYTSSGGTTGDSGQDLWAFYDLTDTPTNGGDISVVWATSSQGGVLKLGTTS